MFGVWHGDRRLQERFGESYEKLKSRTSVIPFLAIIQGRQTLHLQEFLRWAYLGVGVFVLLFWQILMSVETVKYDAQYTEMILN